MKFFIITNYVLGEYIVKYLTYIWGEKLIFQNT